MIEGINNAMNRIREIQNGLKVFKSFKPEVVGEFENMYVEALSKNKEANEVKSNDIHPYIKEKETDQIYNDSKTLTNKNAMIDNAIKNASKKYKVSEELIRAVIKVESNYNPNSVSKAGAMGLMQLIPKTALELGVEKPFDIYENIDGGTKYLKKMLNKYNNNVEKALAAYNAGPQAVDLAKGVPDIEETKNYVMQIKNILIKNFNFNEGE